MAVMDADKEGFLRSETSLIQTAGRASRNEHGMVILYADQVTDSMRRMLETTRERRERQMRYNAKHGITPQTVRRSVQSSLRIYEAAEKTVAAAVAEDSETYDLTETLRRLEQDMHEAAAALEFERAAMLRDQIFKLQGKTKEGVRQQRR